MNHDDVMKELSPLELSALCSNLAKACANQTRSEEAEHFTKLANFYAKNATPVQNKGFSDLEALIMEDLSTGYPEVSKLAKAEGDRGGLRAAVWGDKVSKLLKSLLSRYEKQKDALLENTEVWVCEVCGFIFVGDLVPAICPICKAPSSRIMLVKKEAV